MGILPRNGESGISQGCTAVLPEPLCSRQTVNLWQPTGQCQTACSQPPARPARIPSSPAGRSLGENITGLRSRRAVCQREQTAFSAVSLRLGLCLPTLLSDTATSPASFPLLSKLFMKRRGAKKCHFRLSASRRGCKGNSPSTLCSR